MNETLTLNHTIIININLVVVAVIILIINVVIIISKSKATCRCIIKTRVGEQRLQINVRLIAFTILKDGFL